MLQTTNTCPEHRCTHTGYFLERPGAKFELLVRRLSECTLLHICKLGCRYVLFSKTKFNVQSKHQICLKTIWWIYKKTIFTAVSQSEYLLCCLDTEFGLYVQKGISCFCNSSALYTKMSDHTTEPVCIVRLIKFYCRRYAIASIRKREVVKE